MMASPLSAALRSEYDVRSMPIRKDDEVIVTRGLYKGRQGRVNEVYRRKWVIHIEGVERTKVNGNVVPVGIDASKVAINKLKLDSDRLSLLKRKGDGRAAFVARKSAMKA